MRSLRRSASQLLLLVLFGLVGCSSEPDLYDVTGTVSYDGKPVPKGVIWFDPEPGNTAPQGYAMVNNGQFNTAAENGRGVRGGPYLIRIQGFDGVVGPEMPFGKSLFPDHSEKKDLPKAKNELKVDVKKK